MSYVCFGSVHRFLNIKIPRVKVRKLQFSQVISNQFHKTKYIVYSNMSTIHKDTAYSYSAGSICKLSNKCNFCDRNVGHVHTCFKFLQVQRIYISCMFIKSAHICICNVLCFMKTGWI